ncbi:MAG: hypothetical protein R3B72_29715 [Polyangiaceae bacterium]
MTIVPALIPASFQVSAPGYPEELTALIEFNNDYLVPHIRALDALRGTAERYMRHNLQFVNGARTLVNLYRLIQRYAPPTGNQADINALMNETEIFYSHVVQLFRTYPPLQISHPTFWQERQTAVEEAQVLLDFVKPMPNRGRESVLERVKTFFAASDPRARNLQSQIKPYLDRNFSALNEQLCFTTAADEVLTRAERALSTWERSSHDVHQASNAFEVLLYAGQLISASVGNMADPGDSFAVGIIRFRVWRALSASRADQPRIFQHNIQRLARASGVSADELTHLLSASDNGVLRTSEVQQQNYDRAREMVLDNYHTEFGISMAMTCLSGLQTIAAIAALSEPSDDELDQWIQAGTSAYFTGADLVVTLERGYTLSARMASAESALARRMVTWLPRINHGAIAIASGYGFLQGVREAADGWRDGDMLHVAAGGVSAGANLAVGYAAVAELFSFAGASAATGWGIVLSAAAIAIGVVIIIRDSERATEAQREEIHHQRLGTTGRTIGALMSFLLGSPASMSRDGQDSRALWSRSEPNPSHHPRPFWVAGRDPEPPAAAPSHLPMVRVIDREAGTDFEHQLRRMKGRLPSILFFPLQANTAEEARQMLAALDSLGFDTRSRSTRDMVRLDGHWIR